MSGEPLVIPQCLYVVAVGSREYMSIKAGACMGTREKCGVRLLVISAVHRCVYSGGSGADPAHKHPPPLTVGSSKPLETRSCPSYFVTHLDALTTILVSSTLHKTTNTLICVL